MFNTILLSIPLNNSRQLLTTSYRRIYAIFGGLTCAGALVTKLLETKVSQSIDHFTFISYKALNGLAPDYITDLLDRYVPTRSLWSSDHRELLLKVPSTNNVSFGDRAFSVATPKLWNSVPYEIRSSDYLNQFKSKLRNLFVSHCLLLTF